MGGERPVGGTFDHLHPGHKLLLTGAVWMAAPEAATTRIVIGLTGESMLAKKAHREHMQSWTERATRVLEFVRGLVDVTPYDCRKPLSAIITTDTTATAQLHDEGRGQRQDQQQQQAPRLMEASILEWRDGDHIKRVLVQICELNDPYGPPAVDETISALVTTKETESGGWAVNCMRQERGLAPLEVGVVDLILDGVAKISSTDLRKRAAANARTP